MDFLKTLEAKPFMLYDGPMESRIKYESKIKLDQTETIFTLIYTEEGQHELRRLYEKDIATTEHYHAPIILNAPTFRASPIHCERMGYKEGNAVENINRDAIQFIKDIREKFGSHKYNIYISAPIGPKSYGDYSYTQDEAEIYHTPQAAAIVKAGVDIISIAAMPGITETIGCAKAVAKVVADAHIPYSIGVMINPEGTLLDGTTLKELIARLDETISPRPNFYVLSCTHPINAKHALHDHDPIYQRVLGIKANGSNKAVKKLIRLNHKESDDPEMFADELIWLGKEFNFKIYGGCCGTNDKHLEALARKLSELYAIGT